MHWIIPSDGITLVDPSAPRLADGSDWDAQVLEARHLGEISLITLALGAVSGAQLLLTLSGPQRQGVNVGGTARVKMDLNRVHVMPMRPR